MTSVFWAPLELISRVEPCDGMQLWPYHSAGEVPELVPEAEVFVLPHPVERTSLDRLSSMKNLRLVQVLSSGFDHVLGSVPAQARLCNAPSLHAKPTAETAMSLILAAQNRVPEWSKAQWRGAWADPGPRECLGGKTVVVLGFGAVGQAVAKMLSGFDVRIIPVARRYRAGVRGVADLADLLPEADVMVVAVPLSERTRGLVSKEFLGRMKSGALLVNVARGPVVDSDALLAEVSSGRLRAALDVVDPEPLPYGHPLWSCPGVLISPHVGGNTVDFWDRAATFVSGQFKRYVAGQPLLHLVER